MNGISLTVVCAVAVGMLVSGCKRDSDPIVIKGGSSDAAEVVTLPFQTPTEDPLKSTILPPPSEEEALSCTAGCSSYQVGSECCNIFGCNCDGPCWNAGCKTKCQKGDYPGYTVSCPGNDKHYNCCPTGSKCKPNCSAKKGQCCCTGGGKTIISIDDVQYDLNNSSKGPDPISAQVNYSYRGSNAGPMAAPVGTIDTSVTSTQTDEWSFESATEISASAEVKAGIPFFGEGKLTIGAKETLKYGEKHSKSISTSIKISLGNDYVPAYSYQEYLFNASMFQFQIPFTATATVIDDCGTRSTQTIKGSTKLAGVASFTEGQFSKIIGPAIPIECKAPFDTPIEKQKDGDFCSSGPMCADNALCVRYGQTSGTCCTPGNEQPCCAVAAGHKQCIEQGYKPAMQLCPSTNGNFAPCCNPRSVLVKKYGVPRNK